MHNVLACFPSLLLLSEVTPKMTLWLRGRRWHLLCSYWSLLLSGLFGVIMFLNSLVGMHSLRHLLFLKKMWPKSILPIVPFFANKHAGHVAAQPEAKFPNGSLQGNVPMWVTQSRTEVIYGTSLLGPSNIVLALPWVFFPLPKTWKIGMTVTQLWPWNNDYEVWGGIIWVSEWHHRAQQQPTSPPKTVTGGER